MMILQFSKQMASLSVCLSAIALQAVHWGANTANGRSTPVWQESQAATDQSSITTVSGRLIKSSIESIVDGAVSGPGIPDTTRLDNIMSIRTSRDVVFQKPNVAVYLTSGGVLYANSILYENEQFTVGSSLGTFQLGVEAVRGLLFEYGSNRATFEKQLSHRSPEKDLVVAVTSGGQQSVMGILESIASDKIYLNYQGKSRPISVSKVVGIVAADLKPPPIQGVIGSVKMVDGSTITGAIAGIKSGKMRMTLSGNQSISFDWSNVSSVSIRSERVAYLSDLEPTDVQQNALATVAFNWRRDLSVGGNPIRLRGADGKSIAFAKGIGTHSACRLEFSNDQGFNRFVAMVGIDAETEGQGDCDVSVSADGIELWSNRVTGSSDPVSVDVEITGMKSVTLIVRNGEHLDLGDHVDWADARFIKTD